ncbi:MAG: DUF6521 family protein [Bacteroidales bacterium]|nr:DUF6521 family protein [Bacteroidales bacterium]
MDKNAYYIYNNEAIACCTLYSIIRIVKELDYSKYCLILPFLLDDKTIVKLKESETVTIEDFIKQNIDIFGNFNQRYLSLLPITINSSIMLSDFHLIRIDDTISLMSDSELDFSDSGDRLGKILSVVDKFCIMFARANTSNVYKLLNIDL